MVQNMIRKKDQPQPSQANPTEKVLENKVEDEEEDEEDFLLDNAEDLLSDLDDTILIEEPDQSTLSIEEQDLESLVKEEPLELLDNPNLVMELSEDPVRLYLKEIGGIDLLGTDREFWLATRLETARRIEVIIRDHPLARKGEPGSVQNIYQALYDELLTAWKRLLEDTGRLGYDAQIWLEFSRRLRCCEPPGTAILPHTCGPTWTMGYGEGTPCGME
jgi:hypothetical protein